MDAGSATLDQVKPLVGLLPVDREVPLFVFDAGYNGVALGHGLADTRAEVLVRMASTRVFHPDSHPRRDGTVRRPLSTATSRSSHGAIRRIDVASP